MNEYKLNQQNKGPGIQQKSCAVESPDWKTLQDKVVYTCNFTTPGGRGRSIRFEASLDFKEPVTQENKNKQAKIVHNEFTVENLLVIDLKCFIKFKSRTLKGLYEPSEICSRNARVA